MKIAMKQMHYFLSFWLTLVKHSIVSEIKYILKFNNLLVLYLRNAAIIPIANREHDLKKRVDLGIRKPGF